MSCPTSSAAGRRRRMPGARGGVMGMDLREDAASLQELYVAGLCGLAYGLADIVRKLERSGYEFDSIIVSGGAARSALVRQIIADVCGKTVELPETPEPVLLGSAMVGAVAAGTQTMASAMSSMSTLAPGAAAPAGGAIAAFHARKAHACEMLRRTEREIRELDSQVSLAGSGHFRLRRRAGRQRSDRARRHAPQAERSRPSPDRSGNARTLPGAAARFGHAWNRNRTRGAVARGVFVTIFRARFCWRSRAN